MSTPKRRSNFPTTVEELEEIKRVAWGEGYEARGSGQSRALVRALEPFVEALESLGDEASMVPDETPLEDALWRYDQPTIGELRALVAAI